MAKLSRDPQNVARASLAGAVWMPRPATRAGHQEHLEHARCPHCGQDDGTLLLYWYCAKFQQHHA
eukprot:11440725-Alexandrium_andersonii.AAC.1